MKRQTWGVILLTVGTVCGGAPAQSQSIDGRGGCRASAPLVSGTLHGIVRMPDKGSWAILGVGAGAHGKLTLPASGSIIRTLQLREPRRYLASVPAAVTRTPVPREQLPFEFMLNALRLVGGFDAALFEARTGLPWSWVATRMDSLVARGLMVNEGSHFGPSPQGLRFLNELLLTFVAQSRPKTAQMAGAFGLSTAS